jgi:hypothetical protein
MATLSTQQQETYNAALRVKSPVNLMAEDASVSVNIATSEQTNLFLNSAAVAQNVADITSVNATITSADVVKTAANAVLASQQAQLAVAAKTAAESARDTAVISSNIFSSIATGLTGTANGKYFSVPSPVDEEYLILYRNDNNTATEIKRYPSVLGLEYTTGNTLYVKSNGNDSNDGGSWKTAFATIEHALAVATELEKQGVHTLIEIGPFNVYKTKGHLDMPDNCVVKAVHRTVFIQPEKGYEQRNVFRMGSGCFLEGVMFEGWQVDDFDNPTEGFAVSFRPGATITRVPYAHKIAVRALPDWGKIPPPLDAANGNPYVKRAGGVCLADGSVISQYSIFPNIMTWGATPVLPNGIGYCAKNGALINAVNAVSIWAHKHFMAISGGQLILSGCSTQFGDYTLFASGGRNLVNPTRLPDSFNLKNQQISNLITKSTTTLINDVLVTVNNTDLIVNYLLSELAAKKYDINLDSSLLAKTESDTKLLLQCLYWVTSSGNQQPMLDFAKGMFDTNSTPVYLGLSKSEIIPTVQDTAAIVINSVEPQIIEAVCNALQTAGYTSAWNWTNQDGSQGIDQTYTRRDTLTLLNALEQVLQNGDESWMHTFAKGLYTPTGTLVISDSKFGGTLYSFNFIRDYIVVLPGLTAQAIALIKSLFTALIYKLNKAKPTKTDLTYTPNAAVKINDSDKQGIIDAVCAALVSGGYTSTWDWGTTAVPGLDQKYTRRDTNTLLTALQNTLNTGNEQYMLDFAIALYNSSGELVFTDQKIPGFKFSFTTIRDRVLSLSSINASASARSYITALFAALNSSISVEVSTSISVTKYTGINNVLFINDTIPTAMWNILIAQKYTTGWTTGSETTSDKSTIINMAKNLMTSIRTSIYAGNDTALKTFIQSLFTSPGRFILSESKTEANIVAINYVLYALKTDTNIKTAYPQIITLIDNFSSVLFATINKYSNVFNGKNAFTFSFNTINNKIIDLMNTSTNPVFSLADKTIVDSLISTMKSNIFNPNFITEPSRITAIGHTWTSVMGGVALTKIPPANNNANIQDSIVEENDAIVIASGQDDQGNALFVGGLQISADTGELGGTPFDQAVRRVATRASISRSF